MSFCSLARLNNDDVSIVCLVVFNGVLEDVKEHLLIKHPIRVHQVLRAKIEILDQVNIDVSLEDRNLERPDHVLEG